MRALRIVFLVAIAAFVIGIFQILTLDSPHKAWMFFLACVAGVFFFGWLDHGFRQLNEPLLRNRQQELAAKLVRGETLEVRGTPGVFVPMMLSLGALAFVLPTGLATTLSGRVWLAAGIGLLATFWYGIVPRLRAPVLELDRDGLRTKQFGRVSWSDIESARLRVNGSVDSRFVASHVLSLEFVIDRHPRPSQGLRRWAQAFFRGMREWEARIPLRNPSENPLVILNLLMFCIRNTPRYQEQRRLRRTGPPELLAGFEPHDLPGLPLSHVAADAKTATQLTRATAPVAHSQPPSPARRIVRQRFIHRSAPQRLPQWVVISMMLLIFVLCVYGLLTGFFLSPAWMRASLVICIAMGALPSWHMARAIMLGTVQNPEVTTPFVRAIVAWVLGPILICGLGWSIVGSALPDILTRTLGTPFRETHSLRKEYSDVRRGCDYRVMGPPFENGSLKNHYCSWPGEYQRLPAKGPMVVRGRETWLGRHYDSVEPVDPLLSR